MPAAEPADPTGLRLPGGLEPAAEPADPTSSEGFVLLVDGVALSLA